MARIPLRRVGALRGDDRGAALVEFAIIAPVLIVTLLALFDLSYNIYATSLLEGAIQKAGRDSTLQGGDARASAIDAHMRDVVDNLPKFMKS